MTNAIIPLLYSISILNFFGSGGLMEVMDGVFIANLWMTPVFLLFVDISYYLKLYNLWKLHGFMQTGEGTVYTQHEANEIYKKLDWAISSKYASILKTFAVTLFYIHVMPYCIFYTIATFIIQYYVEKVSYESLGN